MDVGLDPHIVRLPKDMDMLYSSYSFLNYRNRLVYGIIHQVLLTFGLELYSVKYELESATTSMASLIKVAAKTQPNPTTLILQ